MRRKKRTISISSAARRWAAERFVEAECFAAAYVGDLLVEILGIPLSEIRSGSRFAADLQADELEPVEIVMAIEEDFGIYVTDEHAEKLRTVADLVRYLHEAGVRISSDSE